MSDAVTVSQLNKYVSSILESDSNLSGLFVKGEISSFKSYSSGHLYFNLKDDKATVSCVMFRASALGLDFEPRDGSRVVVYAKASVYERDGKYQLYISSMKIDGVGDLYLAFENLKKRLEEEGLFDPSHKRKIPLLPKRIGVVTSPSGAVIRDIIHVLNRRFAEFSLVLYPTAVQGQTAARAIVNAIEELNRFGGIDVLIVGRGGGSMEDLWCFNEEIVARAVYASAIPVISAVGHETDFTICDFVADLRAPTPSAAAELAMPVKTECLDKVRRQTEKCARSLENKIDYAKLRIRHCVENRIFIHPEFLYEKKREEIDILQQNIQFSMERKLDENKTLLSHRVSQLDGLSPLKVLQRGYGILQKKDNPVIVRSCKDVLTGDEISVRIFDGELDCWIKDIKPL